MTCQPKLGEPAPHEVAGRAKAVKSETSRLGQRPVKILRLLSFQTESHVRETVGMRQGLTLRNP